MRWLTLTLSLLIAQPVCGTDEVHEILRRQDPDFAVKEALFESVKSTLALRTLQDTCPQSTYIIPVVFHVIYSSAQDSISYTRILSQIWQLFEDFRKVPGTRSFAGSGVDMEIEFSLATKDPNGAPTDGVTYHHYTELGWTSPKFCRETQDASMKAATGWPSNKYLNVWIVPDICIPDSDNNCTVCNYLAGYAYYPIVAGNIYGAVIEAASFWGSGRGRSSRTVTHELGHNLYLIHPFEDGCTNAQACNFSNDRVCDTPPTAQYNFVVRRQNTCNQDNPDQPDNTRNYMDYVMDADMSHFTEGQKARSWLYLQSSTRLYPLWQDNNLFATGTGPYGHLRASFWASPRISCPSKPIRLLPYVMGSPNQFVWEIQGKNTPPLYEYTSCPIIRLAQPDTYSVTLYVENLSGRKDTFKRENFIIVQDSVFPVPFQEGFETNVFPPPYWHVDNPDMGRNGITWRRYFASNRNDLGAFGRSAASARITLFTYSHYHEKDALITPPLNLTGDSTTVGLRLSFSYAYACYTVEKGTDRAIDLYDSLTIYLSKDCSYSWQKLWTKSGPELLTQSDTCLQRTFIPDSTQWRSDTIDLTPYLGEPCVYIKFESHNGWGNNLYLDDIRIDTIRGTRQPSALVQRSSMLRLGQDERRFTLYSSQPLTDLHIQLYDIQGRKVWENHRKQPLSPYHFSIPNEMSRGIYLLWIEAPEESLLRRVWLP